MDPVVDELDLFEELFEAGQQPTEDEAALRAAAAVHEAEVFNSFFEDVPADSGSQPNEFDQPEEPEEQHAAADVPVPVSHSFGNPEYLHQLGSKLQVGLFKQFLRYAQKHDSLPGSIPRQTSFGGTPRDLTLLVLHAYLTNSAQKSVAAVSEMYGKSEKTVRTYLERSAACMIHGSSWLVGASLVAWSSLFAEGRFEPILLIHKMRYDETPLRMKLKEFNLIFGKTTEGPKAAAKPKPELHSSMQQDSRYCKILRLEWQLGFLTFDRATRSYKMVQVAIPVPLAAVSRNTAECLFAVISQTVQRLPGLRAFEDQFPNLVRTAIIDRFSANFKAERHLRSNHPHEGFVSSIFACDVHRESSAIKQGLWLTNNTMSGLVNLALALEGSGMLSRMRTILQSIFKEELAVVHQFPPDGCFDHRKQVLDLFLPAKGPKSLKRRFVLQSLCNGDLTSSDITHYCSFSCCSSPEHTLHYFQTWVVWALLPAQLPVLNRKSWTGADKSLQWAGLLDGHYHLLPRIILRLLKVDRPRSVNASSIPTLSFGADSSVDDMSDFNLLLQDRVTLLASHAAASC